MTIYPYLLGDTWVFDDPRTGLKEEAFVCGMTEMINRIVEMNAIPNAGRGFALQFSDKPFPNYDVALSWLRSDDSQVLLGQDGSALQILGNWYQGHVGGELMQGWLCPALGLYFSTAPRHLYVRAEPLPPGVDPVWQVDRNAELVRRFVSADQPKI